MKILAVVEDSLRKIFQNVLGCEVVFFSAWKEAKLTKLGEYAHAIISAKLIENPDDPFSVRGVAAQLHIFGVHTLFVDLPRDEENLTTKLYPQVKNIVYKGQDALFLHLLSVNLPEDAFEKSEVASHTMFGVGLVDNDLCGEDNFSPKKKLSVSHEISGKTDSVSGVDNLKTSAGKVSQTLTGVNARSLSVERLDASDATPFKVVDVSQSASKPKTSNLIDASSFTKKTVEAIQPVHSNEDSDFSLSELNACSGISLDKSDMQYLDAALESSAVQNRSSMGKRGCSSFGRKDCSKITNDEIIVERSLQSVMLGNLEFGSLIRIIYSIIRAKMTGILEVQTETRTLRLEFRQGKVSSTSKEAQIQSALVWSAGSYNFSSGEVLFLGTQIANFDKIISQAILNQFPLNSILRALEFDFSSYIYLTNFFDASKHQICSDMQWWKQCDGKTQLAEIMMASGVSQDEVCRDIFRSLLCDEIFFRKESGNKKIRIEYDVPKMKASNRVADSNGGAMDQSSSSDAQKDAIRAELQSVRASFDTADGYTILGVKPGCGSKALDDAYYAWVNRYHADRFVRFKEPAFMQLSNELLMLMNGIYARTSKKERLNNNPAKPVDNSKKVQEETVTPQNIQSRVGVGRARVSTIHSKNDMENLQPVSTLSSKPVAPAAKEAVRPQRTHIRPASVIIRGDIDLDDNKPATASNSKIDVQPVKMSDFLANRNKEKTPTAQDFEAAAKAEAAAELASREAAKVTPEQHFTTAKKKIALGLGHDALTAINWAVEGNPENIDYKIYQAYAKYLVDSNVRQQSLEIITALRDEIRASMPDGKLNDEYKKRFFPPYYFIGKLELAVEHYKEAKEAFTFAAKCNPNDIDTQRSLRYIGMQIDKLSPEEAAEIEGTKDGAKGSKDGAKSTAASDAKMTAQKGIFAKFMDRLNKPL